MQPGQPLKWIRIAGALVGVVLTFDAQAGLWFEFGGPKLPYWYLSLAFNLLLVALFVLNTRDFPARRPWHSYVLAAQILIHIPVNSDFNALSAITIPLVQPPGKRLRWFVAQCLASAASLLFLIWRQWPTIVTEADKRNLWSQLWTAIPLMLVETLAWGTLAYVAALLITQMEADRRRLVSVNAELLSSRAMLAESSRAAERLDIARELHDSLGHHLTTLNLELELSHRVPAPEKEGHVKQAQFLARLLLADLRETVSSWRLPHTTGLPQALAALATGINTVNVQVDIDPALPAIDAPRSHALLRCAQEAVTNALRHSAANRIDVSLAPHETGIVLRVADNGYGCPLPALGNGLNGIRERAESFAGHARFESLPAGGFLVEVILP